MKTIYLDLHQKDTASHSLNASNASNDVLPASVLTIGNFDGVHLGHQAMLQQLKETAHQHTLASMVMIFEPQPREYFAKLKGTPEATPARLTSQAEKLALLKKFGIDIVVVATFDDAFRSLTASQFADMLVAQLNVSALVLGDDFKFGHDRTGDSEFLRRYGLPVTNLHTVTDTHNDSDTHTDTHTKTTLPKAVALNNQPQDNRISSTRIRERLQMGDIHTANHLLGHDYSMTGKVIRGDAIGRTLNFPTANIELNRLRPALHGVYGVDVVMLDEFGDVITNAFNDAATPKQGISGLRPHSLFGTSNIGIRPSVDKPHEWRLEVFFPNFSGDLYDKTLNVRFLHYLHDERKYPSLDALKAGIQQDVEDLIAWRHRAN